MAYDLKWLDDSQKILHLTFIGNWGWIDVERCRASIRGMVADIPHEVSVIVDFNTEMWIPGSIDLHVHRFNQSRNPKVKMLILVITNPLFRNLALLYSKKPGGLGYPVKLVSNLQAARQLAADSDA